MISLLGLKAEINLPEDSFYTGSAIEIEYDISNRNFFSIPLLLFYSNINKKLTGQIDKPKNLSLSPRETFKYKEALILKRRGFYTNIDLNICVSDIFSIFNFKKVFHNKAKLLIYPSIIELDSFRITSNKNLGEILVENSMFQDKTSISTIKDYSQGDPINQIHWKVSAKRDSPMIKAFEKVSNTDLNIFLDSNRVLFKDDLDRRIEDKMVDASLAIVNYFLNLDIEISLNTFLANKRIEISSKEQKELKPFLDLFARFKGDGPYSIGALIEDSIHSLADNSIVVIVTPNLDKEIGAIAIKLKMKNLIPIFIIISDRINNNIKIDKTVEKRLTEENIEIYFIDYSSNVKEELEIRHG
nr:DUF58 domain-containing protein [Tissierella sp.]